jgi:hypothetical protein
MNTHSIIIQGGLGNQLFQIYALLNYCIENHCFFILPYSMQPWDKRHTYWDSIFSNLSNYVKPNHEINVFKEYNEPHFYYNEIPLFTRNVTFRGYFQTELYFKKHFEKICSMLNIREKQTNIKNSHITCENTISLHFRMGDYGSPAHHPIIPDTYYINSLNYIISKTNKNKEDWNVYYSCEQEDDNKVLNRINNIVNSLNFNCDNLNFIKISNIMEDWEQLLLMSACKYNVIANSTFSWWSAYFNTNNQKIVCYPSIWFGYALAYNNLKDLYPPDWIKIDI